uniref:RING-type domain-containing protein n=1 Tax=Mola mola TaxID=94237 RepID=A0A3Q3X6B0_MOLML
MEDLEMRLREMLMCSVCQDIFRDPRQLSCGHSMCMECLVNLRDHSTDTPFRCPDCRDYFGPVIEVLKSYTLTNIAEEFREFRNRKVSALFTYSVSLCADVNMPNDAQERIIYCDCCLDKQTVALKTCLKCEVSLCEQHVMDHLTLPVFTGHPLVKPLHDLQERKCPKHDDEVLRFYCKASRRYVCNVCALESKQQSLTTEACSVLRRQLTVSHKEPSPGAVITGGILALRQQRIHQSGFARAGRSDSSGLS